MTFTIQHQHLLVKSHVCFCERVQKWQAVWETYSMVVPTNNLKPNLTSLSWRDFVWTLIEICQILWNFRGFSQIFAVFYRFQLLSRQVYWKQVQISLLLTRFMTKINKTEQKTNEYLTFLSLSLSLLCENGAGAIASAPFYTTPAQSEVVVSSHWLLICLS